MEAEVPGFQFPRQGVVGATEEATVTFENSLSDLFGRQQANRVTRSRQRLAPFLLHESEVGRLAFPLNPFQLLARGAGVAGRFVQDELRVPALVLAAGGPSQQAQRRHLRGGR